MMMNFTRSVKVLLCTHTVVSGFNIWLFEHKVTYSMACIGEIYKIVAVDQK